MTLQLPTPPIGKFKNIIKREWKLEKVDLIPVIIRVTGLYRKKLKEDLERISLNMNIDHLQTEVVKMESPFLKEFYPLEIGRSWFWQADFN